MCDMKTGEYLRGKKQPERGRRRAGEEWDELEESMVNTCMKM